MATDGKEELSDKAYSQPPITYYIPIKRFAERQKFPDSFMCFRNLRSEFCQ
jgi:hypothetical protein